MIAIYPGSFDPVTLGHLGVIKRAAAMFEHVVVAVAINSSKKGLFLPKERVELLDQVLRGQSGIEVDGFSGLLVDYVQKRNANVVIRGLRAVADFEYEFQLALMNRRLAPTVDTVFLMTDERYFYVSSSLVREVAQLGGDVKDFVPDVVRQALHHKLTSKSNSNAESRE